MLNFNIAIVGAAGYTGGEALELLLDHPHFRVAVAQSNSQAGKPVWQAHPRLRGRTELVFQREVESAGVEIDAWVLCTGHGRAKAFVEEYAVAAEGKRIVDLSTDFRQNGDHGFVYGLPEAFATTIRTATRVANPGCFATAIQLALLPLAGEGWLRDPVSVTAITGSTGAGQAPSPTTHFSWRADNLSAYKPFDHQHLGEIRQTLRHLADVDDATLPPIHFVPVRGNFARGIFAVTQLPTELSQAQADELFAAFYAGAGPKASLTFAVTDNPDLQQVVRTNKALVHPIVKDGQLGVITMLDNLRKGASSQAIENLNLMFGLERGVGLI